MPIDKDGNRADIVIDPTSTISRLNIGRLYEHYINGASRDVAKRIRDRLGIPKGECSIERLYNYDQNVISEIYNYLLRFYYIISPRQHEFYSQLKGDDILEALTTIVNDDIYLYIPIDNNRDNVEMVKNIEREFNPTYDVVSYVGNSGIRCTTKDKVRIAPMYMMLLEKIADDWSSVASGKLQHFGVLSPIIRSEKFSSPFRNSPTRTIGETEGRIICSYAGPEAICEMMDRSNNPITMRNVYSNILNSEKPTNIDEVVDRNFTSLGGSKPIQLVRHMLNTSGIDIVYSKEY